MQARNQIEQRLGSVVKQSSLYQTEAWGMRSSPVFLNQVLLVDSKKAPFVLLNEILKIEASLDRIRQPEYANRTIDIDILYYHDLIINHPELTIPHPRISQRRFVLEPLAEIAPKVVHPVLQETNIQLLMQCTDPLAVTRMQV
jgi:2-amino-4-hydroxy-6-hydroxymethyldihydropteridine diphosphokinase